MNRVVQLIQKVEGTTGLFLVFWDNENETRMSMVIEGAQRAYNVGEIYFLDKSKSSELDVLRLVEDKSIRGRKFLIPVFVSKEKSTTLISATGRTLSFENGVAIGGKPPGSESSWKII